MEFDATQLGSGGSAGGQFRMTNGSSSSDHECPMCGGGSGGGNHQQSAGTSVASNTDAMSTSWAPPSLESMLPGEWTVDEVSTVILAANTAVVAGALYYSYKGGA